MGTEALFHTDIKGARLRFYHLVTTPSGTCSPFDYQGRKREGLKTPNGLCHCLEPEVMNNLHSLVHWPVRWPSQNERGLEIIVTNEVFLQALLSPSPSTLSSMTK